MTSLAAVSFALLVSSGLLLAEEQGFQRIESRDGVSTSKDGTTVREGGNSVEMGSGGRMKIDTQNPDFDRGTELLFADRMREALQYFERSLDNDPTNPQTHLNRAEAYFHLDDFTHQIDECDQAIALSNAGWIYRRRHSERVGGSDPEIAKDLGTAYAKRGFAKWALHKKEEAVDDFDEATRMGYKSDATLYIYMAQYFLNEGAFDTAFRKANRAIEIDPKLAWPYGLRGLAETKQGKDAEAAADFQRAGRIDPKVREQCERLAADIRAGR